METRLGGVSEVDLVGVEGVDEGAVSIAESAMVIKVDAASQWRGMQSKRRRNGDREARMGGFKGRQEGEDRWTWKRNMKRGKERVRETRERERDERLD